MKNKALDWWSTLTKPQQHSYEIEMFGYGEYWEDTTLSIEDITKMYNKAKNL